MSNHKPKPFVFVVMPFDAAFDDIYALGIKDACAAAGTYCERLDEQIFEERMLDRIYNQIAKADIIVADVTGRNPNVFYEVGYAHALGSRVILIANDADDIPFDLKHFYHIVYGGRIADLKKELTQRLAWYVANPKDATSDETNRVEYYVQGQDLRKNVSLDITLARKSYETEGVNYTALVLEFTAYNPIDTALQVAHFTPIILAPEFCARCAVMTGSGGAIEFQTVRLPSGQTLHRPLQPCSLEPGAWDGVTFNLWIVGNIRIRHQYEFTLRVLSHGPPQDFPFTVALAIDENAKEPGPGIA